MTASIGNRPNEASLADRIVAVIRDFNEHGREPTTGMIAARLGIKAMTPERDALGEELRRLRINRVVLYEMRPHHEWRLARDTVPVTG